MNEKSGFLKWVICFLIFILGLILGALLLYFLETTDTTALISGNMGDSSSEEEAEATQSKTDTTPLAVTTTYTGTHTTAELPNGWTIVEYTDNTGSDMLMGGTTYSDLVGLKVFNPANDEMFFIKAVDGIGGLAGCDETFEFTDTDASYLVTGNDFTGTMGVTPTVVDLTAETYTEYELLGFDVRRIERTLYRDMYDTEVSGFNPACGIDEAFLTITTLGFSRPISGVADSSYTYSWGIPNIAPIADLEELDLILESLQSI